MIPLSCDALSSLAMAARERFYWPLHLAACHLWKVLEEMRLWDLAPLKGLDFESSG